jgi:hypothetical protein
LDEIEFSCSLLEIICCTVSEVLEFGFDWRPDDVGYRLWRRRAGQRQCGSKSWEFEPRYEPVQQHQFVVCSDRHDATVIKRAGNIL